MPKGRKEEKEGKEGMEGSSGQSCRTSNPRKHRTCFFFNPSRQNTLRKANNVISENNSNGAIHEDRGSVFFICHCIPRV